MPTSITFQMTCDRPSLDQAARMISALQATCAEEVDAAVDGLADKAKAPAAPPAVTAVPGNPEVFIEKWLKRLGPGSRKFWKLVAQHALTQNFLITFEDLKLNTGISTATLRSYHRNSYRAIKDEKAPDPMPGVWSGATKRYEYAMSHAVRDKIIELTKNDAPD
ncbi:MAG: hypothetical protein JWL69_5063 [Phycisphaerales bacterium]|nr:hypothetical protein [Phycisphaerales bacterium]